MYDSHHYSIVFYYRWPYSTPLHNHPPPPLREDILHTLLKSTLRFLFLWLEPGVSPLESSSSCSASRSSSSSWSVRRSWESCSSVALPAQESVPSVALGEVLSGDACCWADARPANTYHTFQITDSPFLITLKKGVIGPLLVSLLSSTIKIGVLNFQKNNAVCLVVNAKIQVKKT